MCVLSFLTLKAKGHKRWWVLPAVPLIQLWLYFRMPSWSAAVLRTSTFPPPFPAPFCLMLDSFRELHCCFLSLWACCYRWSGTGQSCGLCPVACIRNWHSTLAFPGCLASSGALKIVSVNYVFRSYVVCNILFIFRLRCFRPKFTLRRKPCPHSLVPGLCTKARRTWMPSCSERSWSLRMFPRKKTICSILGKAIFTLFSLPRL